MNADERYSRQHDIVPRERLTAYVPTVIGVGAIGRQVALQLAAMGVPDLRLIDFDVVEESNIASQGYREADLGKPKVEATAEACREINHDIVAEVTRDRFRRSMEIGSAVFCCVDKIDIRRLVWQAVQHRVDFFVDGRVSAEILRVLVACDAASCTYYSTTLFTPEEAYEGTCTAKTTIYCANIAAGLMVSQFAKYLRHLVIDPDIQINLLSCELTVTS